MSERKSRNPDTRPDRIDIRDRVYQPPLRAIESEFPPPGLLVEAAERYLQDDMILDQGTEGACTGFGLAAVINSLLWRKEALKQGPDGQLQLTEASQAPAKVSARMLYHLARFYDEWPGEDYEGSSCRGALKAWLKHGVCSEQVWPYKRSGSKGRGGFVVPQKGWENDAAERPLGVYYRIETKSVRDMQAAIQEVGAIYCSARVHSGWERLEQYSARAKGADTVPTISWRADNPKSGGHAFALVGYNPDGFVVQNSWGRKWGLGGFAILSYDDWLANGSDAWVAVMGARIKERMPKSFVPGALNRLVYDQGLQQAAMVRRSRAAESGQDNLWSTEEAYLHSVVMANDGQVVNRLVEQPDGQASVSHVVVERALEFFEGRQGVPRIMIYAHGGLNNEDDSLERIRKMGPYFELNGIYPVFFSWRTGLLESIYGILADSSKRMFPRSEGLGDLFDSVRDFAGDAVDRTLEVASENLGVRAIWSQMKQNAAAASTRGNGDRGVFLTSLALAELKKKLPKLQIHLIGHSAGSILLGHMLDDLPRNKLKVASCSLFAPACSIDFAVRHYIKAVKDTRVLARKNLHIDVLDDERERDDSVGPYRKSLLYLVSRALEEAHKTPLLGLEAAFDADKAIKPPPNEYNPWHPSTLSGLRKWQAFWGNRPSHLVDTDQVSVRAHWKGGKIVEVEKQIDAAHGAFDNDVAVMAATIKRISGENILATPVTDLEY